MCVSTSGVRQSADRRTRARNLCAQASEGRGAGARGLLGAHLVAVGSLGRGGLGAAKALALDRLANVHGGGGGGELSVGLACRRGNNYNTHVDGAQSKVGGSGWLVVLCLGHECDGEYYGNEKEAPHLVVFYCVAFLNV